MKKSSKLQRANLKGVQPVRREEDPSVAVFQQSFVGMVKLVNLEKLTVHGISKALSKTILHHTGKFIQAGSGMYVIYVVRVFFSVRFGNFLRVFGEKFISYVRYRYLGNYSTLYETNFKPRMTTGNGLSGFPLHFFRKSSQLG